jgi:hypothetical protein
VAAGAVTAMAAAFLLYFGLRPPEPYPVSSGRPLLLQRADELRTEAGRACAAKQWATCEAKLDEAKRLDPGGEADPDVVRARAAIAAVVAAAAEAGGAPSPSHAP